MEKGRDRRHEKPISEGTHINPPDVIAQLCEENLLLVPWCYRHRCHCTGVFDNYEDLIMSEGYLALFHAAKFYNPDYDSRFSTIAVTCITSRMLRFIDVYIRHQIPAISLDEEISTTDFQNSDRNTRRGELIADPQMDDESMAATVWVKDTLEKLKKKLTAREYAVLVYHYEGYSLQEIGDVYHISRERARQVLVTAQAHAQRILIREYEDDKKLGISIYLPKPKVFTPTDLTRCGKYVVNTDDNTNKS